MALDGRVELDGELADGLLDQRVLRLHDPRWCALLRQIIAQVAIELVLVRPVPVGSAARDVSVADDVLEADVFQADRQPGAVHHGDGRPQHPLPQFLVGEPPPAAPEAGRGLRVIWHCYLPARREKRTGPWTLDLK